MSEFEYVRQNTLRLIKKNFLQHCNLSNGEAIKVWANWVIVNRIREKQIDEFLPTENLELDNKTVSLLIEKGLPEEDAINFYSNFIEQCQRWKYRYEFYRADKLFLRDFNDCKSITISLADEYPPGLPINVSIVPDPDKKLVPSLSFSPRNIESTNPDLIIDYHGISNKIDCKSIKHLLKCYTGDYDENNDSCDLIKFKLWKLLNNYSLLDGLSYQWALPPETFNLLIKSCDLKAELFASPLNHHVKNYYSLFEVDRSFGSSGDFFNSTYKEFSVGGLFEANPPFIESIFIQASQLILGYLELARDNKVDLAFMWIMPDWLDSFAYRRLKANCFLRKELVFRKGQHKYWEYRKDRLIQANFNTHVLILSSNINFFHKFWPFQTETSFIKTMTY
jgi:hypothetical protein